MIAADLKDHIKRMLWAEAFDCAEQIGNIIPGQNETKSPDELFYDRKPRLYDNVVPFGLIGHIK